MSDDAILGQVALGYSPFIDRQRAVTATRLTVFPLRPDAQLDAAQLLHAVGEVWPAGGGNVSLNIASENLLQDLLRCEPSSNLMIEVPAFMAADDANTQALCTLHRRGTTMLIKGRPLKALPREVLPCFKYTILDLAEERRGADPEAALGAGSMPRNIAHVLCGVRTMDDLKLAFDNGAAAVLGWPIDDPVVDAPSKTGKPAPMHTDLQTVVELISLTDKAAPIDALENVLRRDPSLAYRLMRYINSPAFGLSVEIASFRHAIMMLGYERLKRWLALLLVTASGDPSLRPVMFASVRRGLLMEELVRSTADDEMRAEMFICGVFSLLHRLFGKPLKSLMQTIPVAEHVLEALVDETGPYRPYLELTQAIEAESLFDFRAAADALMMSVQEINRAELRALGAAKQFD